MTVEVWKPVVGHEGSYEVSDQGRVRSLDRVIMRRFGRRGAYADKLIPKTLTGRMLRPQTCSTGYLTVSIGGRPVHIQWLVAAAFLGTRPSGAMVLHRNDTKADNRLSNLRYGSGHENARDAVLNGRTPVGSRHYRARLCEWTAGVIRALRGVWSQADLGMLFGVSASAIQGIHDGRTWASAPLVTREAALEWFYSFGPAGTHTPVNDNAQREIDRRRA